jgi:hypothetical protein
MASNLHTSDFRIALLFFCGIILGELPSDFTARIFARWPMYVGRCACCCCRVKTSTFPPLSLVLQRSSLPQKVAFPFYSPFQLIQYANTFGVGEKCACFDGVLWWPWVRSRPTDWGQQSTHHHLPSRALLSSAVPLPSPKQCSTTSTPSWWYAVVIHVCQWSFRDDSFIHSIQWMDSCILSFY